MQTFRKKFGATYRKIRKSKKMNQDEVAERAGLSISYISDVERGVANPKLDTLEALAKGVEVEVLDLFHYEIRKATASEIRQRVMQALGACDDAFLEANYQALVNLVS